MAIAFVQAAANTANNVVSSVTTTLSSPPTVGNLLVGGFVTRGGYNDVTTWPTDWVKIGLPQGEQTEVANGGYIVLGARICTNASQTALTVSTAVDYKRCAIAEFSGLQLTSVVPGTNPLWNAEEDTASGASRTTPAVVAPGGPALIIALGVTSNGNTLSSSDLTTIDSGTGGQPPTYYFGYRIESNPTTETATFTGGLSGDNWGDVIAVFSNATGRTTMVMV